MQLGRFTSVDAIASRDLARAQKAASALGIPKAYGSYEELLADPEIDAIYNPLPNQMHVPWTIKAAEAGKHVLCEKPISLTVAEAKTLLAVRARTGVKIGEAFMIRSYTQWLRVGELLRSGRIGQLRSVVRIFQLLQQRPRQHPQSHRIRRRRPPRHRLLLHPGRALRIRSRTQTRHRPHRPRPRDENRPPDFCTIGFRRWPGRLHLQHAACPSSEGPVLRHHWSHRNRNPLQRSQRTSHAHLHRRDRRSPRQWHQVRRIPHRRPVHHAGRRLLPRRPRRRRSSRSLWKKPSPTWP